MSRPTAADEALLIGALERSDAVPSGMSSGEIAARLFAYQALLLRWNGTFNLVSRQDSQRLLRRHLLDALQLLPYLQGARVLDVGTGAGLPGMVLAIVRPDLAFTLLDRVGRKVRFLVQARAELALHNVTAVCGDALNWRSEVPFDTVTTRAVTTGADLQALVLPHLATDGVLLAQLGANQLAADVAALPPALQLRDEHRYQLVGIAGEFRIAVMHRSAS